VGLGIGIVLSARPLNDKVYTLEQVMWFNSGKKNVTIRCYVSCAYEGLDSCWSGAFASALSIKHSVVWLDSVGLHLASFLAHLAACSPPHSTLAHLSVSSVTSHTFVFAGPESTSRYNIPSGTRILTSGHHVSSWHYAIRHWLRPWHPRSRSSLRIRTVRSARRLPSATMTIRIVYLSNSAVHLYRVSRCRHR
jgi:hypothetical protein